MSSWWRNLSRRHAFRFSPTARRNVLQVRRAEGVQPARIGEIHPGEATVEDTVFLLSLERGRLGGPPIITISTSEDLLIDEIGQRWSPATIAIAWPCDAPPRLLSPSLTIRVIAPAQARMTADELRQAHVLAARDVLRAALLVI